MKKFCNDYCFVTRWRFAASAADLYDLISETKHYPEWWRGPKLRVREIVCGEDSGAGKITEFELKGLLPIWLRWQLHCTEAIKPRLIRGESTGDFVGSALWEFKESDGYTEVIFEWRIRCEHRLIKKFSWLLRPFFSLHHHWVMRTWKRSLIAVLKK